MMANKFVLITPFMSVRASVSIYKISKMRESRCRRTNFSLVPHGGNKFAPGVKTKESKLYCPPPKQTGERETSANKAVRRLSAHK